jgi:condensin complex subunit 3
VKAEHRTSGEFHCVMAPRAPAVLGTLHDALSTIFDEVQHSLANHRKNSVALYKLHSHASSTTRTVKKGTSAKLDGERAFGDVFISKVNCVLVVKNGPPGADRVARFIGAYIKFMNEKCK